MIKFLSLAAVLLTFSLLTANARAGGPSLSVNIQLCEDLTDTTANSCNITTNGAFDIEKTFVEPGELTLTGFATGDSGAISNPFAETIYNTTGLTAYMIELYSGDVDGPGLQFTQLTTAASCDLMNGNLSIFCSGVNASPFQIDFRLMAVRPVTGYGFSIEQGPTVPEPATIALLGLGLAGLVASRRRKQ